MEHVKRVVLAKKTHTKYSIDFSVENENINNNKFGKIHEHNKLPRKLYP